MAGAQFIVQADGGSRGNPGPAGYGAVVLDARTGEILAEAAEYIGRATNNVAEYKGLIAGLRAARDLDPDARILVEMDSKLVVEQMSGRWKIKHPDMQPLAAEARGIAPRGSVEYKWIPREKNKEADRLANEAMDAGKQGRQWEPRPRAAAPAAAPRWTSRCPPPPPPGRLGRARRPRHPHHAGDAAARRDPAHPAQTVLRQHRQRPGPVREGRLAGRAGRRGARRARHRAGRGLLADAALPADRGGRRPPARPGGADRGGPAGAGLRRLGGPHLRRGDGASPRRPERLPGLRQGQAHRQRRVAHHPRPPVRAGPRQDPRPLPRQDRPGGLARQPDQDAGATRPRRPAGRRAPDGTVRGLAVRRPVLRRRQRVAAPAERHRAPALSPPSW
ncbi:ribonuclease H [Kitasatospora cheerisanensis KCTC 2395]|uniref:Ribonuclease H n=1 Tax=Kitasatospora cheerisanensis KCTC 2395 TaxID=1348663 RepID=A0A066YX05_9ACTN|nr:ribonuclease H [Kitasatospora cheerisanensis KCTC 2395]